MTWLAKGNIFHHARVLGLEDYLRLDKNLFRASHDLVRPYPEQGED